MLTVYKYEIEFNDYFELDLPIGTKILKVDTQFNKPCLWALVNPDNKTERCRFRFAGTGHPIDEKERYEFIDTFLMMGGHLVYHIFEILKD